MVQLHLGTVNETSKERLSRKNWVIPTSSFPVGNKILGWEINERLASPAIS